MALSKYVANRQKDRYFIRELLRYSLVDPSVLARRAVDLPVGPERIELLLNALAADVIAAKALGHRG